MFKLAKYNKKYSFFMFVRTNSKHQKKVFVVNLNMFVIKMHTN